MSKGVMMAEQRLTDRQALAELAAMAGRRRLVPLALLAAAASLTEGIGLLMLLPVAHLVAGDGTAELPAWLGWLAGISFPLLLLAVVGLVSLRGLIVFASNESRRNLGLELSRGFRRMAHGAMAGAEWRWLARQHSADHAAMIIGESDRAASLANDALQLASALVTLAMLTLAAVIISPLLTLALACFVVPVAAVMAMMRTRRAREGEAYWDAYSQLQRLLSDGIEHLRAARIAGAEAIVAREFADRSDRLAELERAYFRIGHRTQMLFQVAAAAMLAAGLYLALAVWSVPLALLLPFIVVAIRAVPLASTIHQSRRSWRYNVPALDRLLNHVREAGENRDAATGGEGRLPFTRAIELQGVTLHFEGRDRPALYRFELTVEAGSILGITGHSGAGKSSLADLLSGLLIPDRGSVTIDGMPLSGKARGRWRRQVGFVEQSPFFLDATIAENLAWGRDGVSDAELSGALQSAAAEFVFSLPLGLATPMGEGGRQFSGGELQRIALARALVAKPDLLILDEVTAALDTESSRAILDSIEVLRGQCTVLLLSHDREVLARADRVVSLGKVP
ncbi:ATP-binding cassette domain-containing protein [Altererythrobacter sp. Z27]|uniref:ATP-binding cassette domain-containing protein n=1 Tax=Altererythrobacter sp. Z27 TaxID=3461147 RepID=UPI0040448796